MIFVFIDGQLLPVSQPPVISNGAVLAALPGGAEKIAVRVRRDPDGVVEVSRGGHHLILTVAKTDGLCDGRVIGAGVPPRWIGPSLFLPLRPIVSCFGGTIAYIREPKSGFFGGQARIEMRLPTLEPIQSPTPIPTWAQAIPRSQVFTPQPLPVPKFTVPPETTPRRTPIPVHLFSQWL